MLSWPDQMPGQFSIDNYNIKPNVLILAQEI